MPHADSVQQKNGLDLEYAYYRFCREQMRPYFGLVMWAFQGLALRHVVMQEILRMEAAGLHSRPLRILEVGSWAGGSAITWAEAAKRYHRGSSCIICVDPWKPYFDMTKRPNTPLYREMFDALAKDTIYDLFLYNVKAAGHGDVVMPLRGHSTMMLPALLRGHFDLVFIDGDHSYAAVLDDLRAAAEILKDGGILCGDDLELQLSDIDVEYARTQIESDYIRDPRSGQEYHPGVTLAVGEFIGAVESVVGCWAVRKRGDRWEKVDLSGISPTADRIPTHLRCQDPGEDPAFREWLERRTRSEGLLLPVEAAVEDSMPAEAVDSSAGIRLCQNDSAELREFMEKVVSMCEQREFQSAVEYYDRHRGHFNPDAELAEFDRLVGSLRDKLSRTRAV
jgi:predicted O-methyltransferase YrrM